MRPWVIQEADIALYPAWKDGTPFHGPGLARGYPSPLLACKSDVSVAETPRVTAATGHSWTGNEVTTEPVYEISVSFPDGALDDAYSRLHSRLPAGGFHILVIRFLDEITREWSCFRFFYVTLFADESSGSGKVVSRSLRFRSTWLQETVGGGAAPSLLPEVAGEVDWVCGARRVTCLRYDPALESWSSLAQNETGDGSRFVNLSPVTGSADDVALSAYFPRVIAGAQVAPALPVAAVEWQNLILARVGNQDSATHHGLLLQGIALQALGIVEPLLTLAQDRMLDEPVVVFRYLRRVYAVFGHGVLAVPRLLENTAPPFSHDYPFRLAVPGAANPATGQSGLTLLPDGAWLDGTVIQVS